MCISGTHLVRSYVDVFSPQHHLEGNKRTGTNLDVRQDGQDGGTDAEQHVDADEDFVLSAAIRMGVVDVEHHHRHQRQQVVQCSDREQSCEHKTHIQYMPTFEQNRRGL